MKILIISTPRAGSSSLLKNISKIGKSKSIFEPYMSSDPLSKRTVEKIPFPFTPPEKCVVKMLVNQVPKAYGTDSDFFNFIISIYKDYDKLILLNRRNLKDHFISYVNLRINNNNKTDPQLPWYIENIESKLNNFSMDEITYCRDIIDKISSKLLVPITYYEDLYGVDRKLSLKTIKELELNINSNELNRLSHPKFKLMRNRSII